MSDPTSTSRQSLLDALAADLIGPCHPEAPGEVLPLSPSRYYVTGFLAPEGRRDAEDPTDDDELAAGPDLDEEETAGKEPGPKVRSFFPASIGLSVFLPPGTAEPVHAEVSWADYAREPRASDGSEEEAGDSPGDTKRQPRRYVWRRLPRGPVRLRLPLEARTLPAGVPVPDSGGLRLVGLLRETSMPGLPDGARALSVFLVNGREAVPTKAAADEAFIFQTSLRLRHDDGFLPRPNRRDESSSQYDDRVADLQFRDRAEHVVGHGVSAEVLSRDGARVTVVGSTWIPTAEVRRVRTHEEPGVIAEMDALATLDDAAALRKGLEPLVAAYRAWIDRMASVALDSDPRQDARDALVRGATRARERIAAGIERLASDDEAFTAFRIVNEAMALAARHRSPERYTDGRAPRWRLFQLAFLLLNVEGIVDPESDDRETVDLLFFPTGGGKTEAYLGIIAMTLVLRRLRGQTRDDAGLGVAVILRYTLRLLTLDQLSRAATLMCALETIRWSREDLGDVRFAVGLWVGRSATDNTIRAVKDRIIRFKNASSRHAASPCPLTNCPWCGDELTRDSLELSPSSAKPTGVLVGCASFRCAFAASKKRGGIPVVFVDEQVYRELPAFLVATVDKFAMLPWRGETGLLFGRVTARNGGTFTGPLDGPVKRLANPLPDGLRPPELIVQDELHLIAGPLGTMVGLYETAIEAMCLTPSARDEAVRIRPKIIAATATVRRATDQVRALFGRRDLAVFPPPGVNDSETFFATVDIESPGRLYAGVAAPGRSMKRILIRVYTALLAAAERVYQENVGSPAADSYMTLAGYFNSLRELGGMRRLVEDEVRFQVEHAEDRRPVDLAAHPWFRGRKIGSEPVELTSRETTSTIARNKARLSLPHADPQHVDVLLASNMISVGVDIDRLGLMVVAGQPKTTSEYIQATSRVGRQVDRPGLVVTCFNLHKPRDRSHYERFATYHESFYRDVEAQSLTPFSGPALDRALAGVLVAMVRLLVPEMTPATGAMRISAHRDVAAEAVRRLAERGGDQASGDRAARIVEALESRGRDLVDAWERLTTIAAEEAADRRAYSRFDLAKNAGKPLLWLVTDEERPAVGTPDAKFAAPTSMRDVETTTHLWIERGRLGSNRR